MTIAHPNPVSHRSALMSSTALRMHDAPKRPPAVVLEPVVVTVAMSNPLACEVTLTQIRLVTSIVPADGSTKVSWTGDIELGASQVNSNATVQWVWNAEESVRLQSVDLTLAPKESRNLKFTLVCQVAGTLSIPGISWSVLCGSTLVPVTHNFTTRGPRLNSSRNQKTTVTYGPPPHLGIPVLPPMARLRVTMGQLPDRLLEGQVHRLPITICNASTQPLTDLTLSSTHPTFIQNPNDSSTGMCVRYVRGAIRECNPVDQNAIQNIPLASKILNPGEQVSFVLWVRPDRRGSHQIRFVFVYAPTSPDESVPKPKKGMNDFRKVHIVRVAHVESCVSLTVVGAPSQNTSSVHRVVAQLRNVSESTNITATGLSIVSSLWHLVKVIAPVSKASAATPIAINNLQVGSAQLCEAMLDEVTLQPTQALTFVLLLSPASPSTTIAPSSAFHVDYDYPGFAAREYANTAGNQVGTFQLTVLWKNIVRSEESRGHLSFNTIPVVASRSDSAADRKAPALADSTSLPGTVKWTGNAGLKCVWAPSPALLNGCDFSFGSGQSCVVQLSLHVVNCSPVLALRVEFEALSQVNMFASQSGEVTENAPPPAISEFTWLGPARRRINRLGPGEVVEIKLDASFPKPGTYDLNRFAVTAAGVLEDGANQSTATPVSFVQRAESHCLIEIRQA
eukprot:c19750_g1_i1.p2 GENE.c19750_g1_i1~~c19750_g1_i1.p2  ORF type:complete len:678 (-),score=148.77 c19750_g1_i1:17-2050(-)